MNEESIFTAAIAIDSPEERDQFLDSACGDNLELRQAVQRLLKLSDSAGSFLEHPILEVPPDFDGVNPITVSGNRFTPDAGCEGALGGTDMKQNPHRESDEAPLSYLEPASREDSLGLLGHYEVLNVVGKGAFGMVLRAFDTKLERIVAIKVLAPEMASMSPARKRFLREARTSARIRHENVVRIHSVEEEPIPYLVMEFIPGRTLQQQIEERGPLDLPSVLRLGKQIAEGLAAAHAQDLIHRDIKPGNILLEGDMEERVKITDFGLARTVDDASMTQSGMIAGTPMYMAPEQANGHNLDQRADLFSLGSVLYQMVTGRPPFRAPSTIAVLKRVTEETPRSILEIIPETPSWMCELIGHLHAKNPAERYSSAREVCELLERCADDLQAGRIPEIPDPSKTATETPVDVSATRPRRSKILRQSPLVKIAAAVVIILGLAGFTEATGVTKLASTVIRLTTGSGTLVIETDDPGVKVAINGEEVTITGSGVEELTLRPGEYEVTALKDGKPVNQELVAITRNGRKVVRMSLEPNTIISKSLGNPISY
ncbi:MAG: serine/threonine-protein kinase [Gimesia chilikensis]|uniref:serine/threonine-protein kinase n=1 Tax=Gimesia chilikensis TaxID=2605989 RepID=UPI0037B21213